MDSGEDSREIVELLKGMPKWLLTEDNDYFMSLQDMLDPNIKYDNNKEYINIADRKYDTGNEKTKQIMEMINTFLNNKNISNNDEIRKIMDYINDVIEVEDMLSIMDLIYFTPSVFTHNKEKINDLLRKNKIDELDDNLKNFDAVVTSLIKLVEGSNF